MAGLLGCNANLSVPSGADIVCSDDSECPTGLQCNLELERCITVLENLSPSVDILALEADSSRPLTLLDVQFSVTDPNGPPFGDDTVDMSLEFSADGATWCPAAAVSGDVSDLSAPRDGATYRLTWDAVASASSTCGSGVLALEPLRDAQENVIGDVLAYTPNLEVRLVATDSDDSPIASAPALSGPFAAGNEPPTVTLEFLNTSFRDQVTIPVRVADDAFDVASLEIEFALPSAPDTWLTANVVLGSLSQIVPRPTPYVFIWDSTVSSTLGGLGQVSAQGVVVRTRARDFSSLPTPHFGAWVESEPLIVDNQSTPSVSGVRPLNAHSQRVAGYLALEYVLTDDESDPVDIQVEFSLDNGASWTQTTEYPGLQSEGRYDLATSPEFLDGSGGRPHIFVWDAGTDVRGPPVQVLVRMVAMDDFGVGLPSVIAVGVPIGGVDEPVIDTYTTLRPNLAGDLVPGGRTDVVVGDFNADGRDDIAAASDGENVHIGIGTQLSLTGAFQNVQAFPVPGEPIRLATGDFDENLVDDIVVVSEGASGGVSLLLGGVGGPTSTGVLVAGAATAADRAAVGDVNGDGHLDVVLASGTDVRVLAGNGAGGLTPEASPYTAAADVLTLAVGDVNGDGIDDVVTGEITGDLLDLGSYEVYSARADVRFGQMGASALSAPVVVTQSGVAAQPDIANAPHEGFRVAISDVDEDGAGEILLTTLALPERTTLTIFNPDGTGGFTSSSTGDLDGWAESITVADTDGDGRRDVVLSLHPREAPGPSYLAVMRQQPSVDNPFSTVALILDDIVGMGNSAQDPVVATTDVNGDGVLGLVTLAQRVGQREIVVWVPETQATPPVGVYNTNVRRIGLAGNTAFVVDDVNRDGVPELMGANFDQLAIFRYGSPSTGPALGNGNLSAGTNSIFIPSSFGSTMLDMAVWADVSGDGLRDFVVLDGGVLGTRDLGVVLASGAHGVGNLGFEAPVAVVEAPDFSDPSFVGDFNDDGFEDVLTDEFGFHQLLLADNDGTTWLGTFTRAQAYTAGNPLAVSDFTGDGILDLFVSTGGSDVATLAGDGTGQFSNVCDRTLSGPGTVAGAFLGDANADGVSDVILALEQAGPQVDLETSFVLDGCVTPAGFLSRPAPGNFESATAYDVSGAGVPELFVATTSGLFVWAVQLDGEAFAGRYRGPNLVMSPPVRDFTFADTNRDGTPELLAADPVDGDLRIAEGIRPSLFDLWTQPLRPEDAVGDWLPSGVDRFGLPRGGRVAIRKFPAAEPRLPAGEQLLGFLTIANRNGVLTSPMGATFRPLGIARVLEGDEYVARVPSGALGLPAGAGARWEVRRRWPLDLSGIGESQGYLVRLPVSRNFTGTDFGSAVVRVIQRRRRWVRASEWEGDPLFGDIAGAQLLPQSAPGQGPLLIPEDTFVEIPLAPGNALANGTGPRFIVDSGGRPEIQVLTDSFGVFQAYLED